jgi:hypothetical protein
MRMKPISSFVARYDPFWKEWSFGIDAPIAEFS